MYSPALRSALTALLMAASLASSGCSPPPRTVEVIGRITHNGRPVERALVVFLGGSRDDQPAAGVTDADGRYVLRTFFSSHDVVRGAVPNRDYLIYIEKYHSYDGTKVLRKMAALGAGPDLNRYLQEEAVYDLWPDGVPEDWPMDYLPIQGIPRRLMDDQATLQKITELQRGISLLPKKYANATTSGLTAAVERSDEPQVFDFDLVGEVEEIKLRPPRPRKEASSHDREELSSTAGTR